MPRHLAAIMWVQERNTYHQSAVYNKINIICQDLKERHPKKASITYTKFWSYPYILWFVARQCKLYLSYILIRKTIDLKDHCNCHQPHNHGDIILFVWQTRQLNRVYWQNHTVPSSILTFQGQGHACREWRGMENTISKQLVILLNCLIVSRPKYSECSKWVPSMLI